MNSRMRSAVRRRAQMEVMESMTSRFAPWDFTAATMALTNASDPFWSISGPSVRAFL